MLTQSRLKNLLSYDNVSGLFHWLCNRGPVKAGAPAHSKNALGYIQIQIDGSNYYGHRLAWLYMHGHMPKEIDHIDGNPSNNAMTNLREVTHKINLQNRVRPQRNSTTGLAGVSKSGHRWRAYICVDGKQRHLGCFASKEIASEAFLAAKRKTHPGCTI